MVWSGTEGYGVVRDGTMLYGAVRNGTDGSGS